MTTTGRVFLTSIRSGRLSSVDEDPSLAGEADTLSKRTHTWADTLQGPDYNSDEYDTDLEEDFPPGE